MLLVIRFLQSQLHRRQGQEEAGEEGGRGQEVAGAEGGRGRRRLARTA